MAREISAGGVVVRRMRDRWWIAAIEPQRGPQEAESSSTRRAQPKKPTLALPKGLVDKGERPELTAVREVREETGLSAEQVTKLKDIRYVYVRSWGDRQRVFKVVSFYLLRYVSGKIGDITAEMRHEVRTAEWIPMDEAPQRLSYPGEREVARLAAEYVTTHPADFASSADTKETEA